MKKVSASTVARLSHYLRALTEMEERRLDTVASEELALRAGTTAAQVRKDLSLFGTFGKRGLGYAVSELASELRSILGLERTWRVALIGAGKIGAALFAYEGLRRQGFYIEAVFDTDPRKIGQRWNGLVVREDGEMERALREGSFDIAIVAVPADAAQAVVDRIVESGVEGILNFAPIKLRVPSGVVLKNVNMAVEMEGLSYALTHGRARRGARKRDGLGGGD